MRISLVHHVNYRLTGLHDLPIFLAKKGYEVADICWSGSRRLIIERTNRHLTRYLVPGLSFSLAGFVNEYPYIQSLLEVVKTVNPEVVHAQSHLFLPTVQAVRVAEKLGLPCIVTVHGVCVERNLLVNSAQQVYLRTLGLDVFKRADRVICLTRSDAEKVVKIGCSSEKIRIVPNAVNSVCFRPCEEREDDLVVWTGRFVPEKGLGYLIEAAKLVVEKHRKVRFLLVGYGPLKTKIKKMAEDFGLLDHAVSFAGPLDRNEVADILGKASLFVFPSLSEGLPISVLEAMSCGLPVVCSGIPGLTEIVKDGINGLMVPPRNPLALSKALLTLLNEEGLRNSMGKASRKLVLERYNWDVVIDQLGKVYSEIAR